MPSADATSPRTLMPAREWPLRFTTHSFGAWCYDTIECKVAYANLEHGDDKPSPPSSTYGSGYLDHFRGGHGRIPNFPSPAVVTWRSRDGEAHRAEIDIGRIFGDQLIRHHVAREEMAELPEGSFRNEPAILLEVNDRTIRVYTRTHVPTRQLQTPGNQYSDFRNDLILVETFTF